MPKQQLRRFALDRSGNFGMMFVIMSFPILAGVGMAIDYTNISRTQSKLQNAVDAAVLFAGRYHEKNDELPPLADVQRFVQANYEAEVEPISMVIEDDQIRLQASTRTPGLFSSLVSPGGFENAAAATVPIDNDIALELVMVLDNTNSMSVENKMVDLQRIAKDFVDDIEEEGGDGDVRIGLVPFTNHVNVGLHNRNAPWLSVPDDKETTEYSCRMEGIWESSNCRQETRYNDGVPYQARVCDWERVGEREVCKDRTTREIWHGCVGSRQKPYTLKDSNPEVRFEGLINTRCGKPIQELTNRFTQLKDAIDEMYPTEQTYMAPGIMWGLRLLSPQSPFTEAKPNSNDRLKVMVVMTDGDNQRSANLPWHPNNWGTDLAQADRWSIEACQEAKANGVTIYSIAFGTTVSASGQAIMRACASDESGYYEARDADALKQAFDDIGGQIFTLRLTS